MNNYQHLTDQGDTDATTNKLQSLDWMLEATCRNSSPTKFFPSDGSGVGQAILVCQSCPVRTECLGYALENGIEHGVWGGTSERERRRISRRRDWLITEFSSPYRSDRTTAA